MSLYALLPGAPSLSPPTTTQGSSCSLYRPANYVTDFVAQAMAKQNNPKPKPRVVLDFSKIESCLVPCKRPHSRSNSLSTADETESLSMSTSSASSTSTSTRHDQHLKIQVREVKINFLKLARRSSSQSTVQRGSVCRSKRDARLRRRERQDNHCSSDTLNSYESAIEFDLMIQFAGRNYSTKRTLQQIAQLRQDLLQEMTFVEKLLQKNKCSDDDEDSSSESSTSWDGDCDAIPSLPRMSEAGVFGGGFAQMSGMMQAYRPALQSWFQTMVAAVSEDSPILANFVWEPLGAEESDPLHASLTQLGSIQE